MRERTNVTNLRKQEETFAMKTNLFSIRKDWFTYERIDTSSSIPMVNDRSHILDKHFCLVESVVDDRRSVNRVDCSAYKLLFEAHHTKHEIHQRFVVWFPSFSLFPKQLHRYPWYSSERLMKKKQRLKKSFILFFVVHRERIKWIIDFYSDWTDASLWLSIELKRN